MAEIKTKIIFNRYILYDNGLVYGLASNVYLKKYKTKSGYVYFKVNNKTIYLHKILAESFIPNPNHLPQVNHKDGNKENNSLDNLEWCTCSYNIKHAWDNALNQGSSKIVKQLDKLGNLINTYKSASEAEKQTKISNAHINKVCNGLRKTAGGFMWQWGEV